MSAEVPDLAPDADGDMQGAPAELPANPMGNVRARRNALASGATSRASPLPERELLLQLLHAGSIDTGSDILRAPYGPPPRPTIADAIRRMPPHRDAMSALSSGLQRCSCDCRQSPISPGCLRLSVAREESMRCPPFQLVCAMLLRLPAVADLARPSCG